MYLVLQSAQLTYSKRKRYEGERERERAKEKKNYFTLDDIIYNSSCLIFAIADYDFRNFRLPLIIKCSTRLFSHRLTSCYVLVHVHIRVFKYNVFKTVVHARSSLYILERELCKFLV